MHVPDNLVGLIIGKSGETIKGINRKSGAIVFIPKEMNHSQNKQTAKNHLGILLPSIITKKW